MAFTVVVVTLAGLDYVGASDASAATTRILVSGTSIASTADSVRAITHPNSATAGFVAAASDPVSIAQASAAADLAGATMIVSTSTTDPAAVNAVVAQKNITTLTFVGSSSAFSNTYRNGIDARVTVKRTALSTSPFERSKKLVPSGTTSFVVAKSANVPAMEAALSYGSATDSAVLVLTGSETANALRSYLTQFSDPRVALAGDPGVSDQLDPDDSDYYAELLVDSVSTTNSTYDNIVQLHVDRKARAANKIVVAPADDLASFALAVLVGRAQAAVTLPAGVRSAITTASPADYYLGLVRAEAKSLTLVGTSTTSAQLTAVATPTSVARSGAPAWTITNTTLGVGNYTVTYTARANATKYQVISWDSSVVATSTTTSLTLPGSPDFMTLVALSSSGVELERIYYRSNTYKAASDRATAITGTIQNGTANIRVLGASGVPRKIVRTEFDPYALPAADRVPPVTVAVTCNTSFTDIGLNPQREYTYEVVNLTLKTGTGCGASVGIPVAASGLPIGGLTLPLTQDPWATSGLSARSEEDLSVPRYDVTEQQNVVPRPGQTWSDAARMQIIYNQDHPEDRLRALQPPDYALSPDQAEAAAEATAIGSQFVFSYQAYIPEAVIVGPGYSMDPAKPVIVFNGSDRMWWDVNNPHTKFDIRAYVGDTSVNWTKWIGETERYHCGYNLFRQKVDCEFVGSAYAPTSALITGSTITSDLTTLVFEAHATNTMEPFAQPIDGRLTAYLDSRSWRLIGEHDRMPVHQFWWAPIYSEGRLAYTSEDFYKLYCLFPSVPGCTAHVNINM